LALSNETVLQMALANLGQTEVVTSITSPVSKAEKLGAIFFDRTRDRILAKHNWSWATRRALLTDVTTTEAKDWLVATPTRSRADMVRFIAIDLGYRAGEDSACRFRPRQSDSARRPLGHRDERCWQPDASFSPTSRQPASSASIPRRSANVDQVGPGRDRRLIWHWALAAKLVMPLAVKADYAQLAEAAWREDTLANAIADDANEAHPDPEDERDHHLEDLVMLPLLFGSRRSTPAKSTPSLFSRTDIPSRKYAVRSLRNFIPTATGAALNRPGFKYVVDVKDHDASGRASFLSRSRPRRRTSWSSGTSTSASIRAALSSSTSSRRTPRPSFRSSSSFSSPTLSRSRTRRTLPRN
jgi:hypothetical protein